MVDRVAVGLLVVAAVAYMAPSRIAEWLGNGHKAYAWESVLYGVQTASLYGALALVFYRRAAVMLVCLCMASASILTPYCRLHLPMTAPVNYTDPRQTVCDAAGIDWWVWITGLFGLSIIIVVLTARKAR